MQVLVPIARSPTKQATDLPIVFTPKPLFEMIPEELKGPDARIACRLKKIKWLPIISGM